MKPDCARCKLKCGSMECGSVARDYGEVTTLHGIRYVTESRAYWWQRVCWGLALIAMAFFCVMEIVKVYTRWQEAPVITASAQHLTSVSQVAFPAVTICPEHKIDRKYIDVQENWDWLEGILNGTIEASSEEKLLAESVSLICETYPISSRLTNNFNPTLDHIRKITEMSLKIDDIFEECVFHFIPRLCSLVFRPILTTAGICYSFNLLDDDELFTDRIIKLPIGEGRNISASSWNPYSGYNADSDDSEGLEYPRRDKKILGIATGLSVTLKNIPGEAQQICSSSNAANYRVMIHSPAEFPSPLSNYLYVSPDAQAMIAVRPDAIVTDDNLRPPRYSPKDRGCFFPEEYNMFGLNYITMQNLYLDKLMGIIYDHCNCSLFYLPLMKDYADESADNSNISFCTRSLDECDWMQEDLLRITNDFTRGCSEVRYRYKMSTSKYATTDRTENNNTGKYNYSKIIVFFEEGSFYAQRKSELYGITDFIASCGGLLGLFTGFSLVSLLEMIYFASLRLACQRHQQNDDDKEKEYDITSENEEKGSLHS